MNPAVKRYYFVDESGVDSKSRIFVVGIAVAPREYSELERAIEGYEIATGKKASKWKQTIPEHRIRFLRAIINDDRFSGCLVFVVQPKLSVSDFDELSVSAIAKIIDHTRDEDVSASEVYVDGLSQKKQAEYSTRIRAKGISNARLHRATDHASAMIRLADALAGLVRDAVENQASDPTKLVTLAKHNGVIVQV